MTLTRTHRKKEEPWCQGSNYLPVVGSVGEESKRLLLRSTVHFANRSRTE